MDKYLVTGSNGFVGCELVRQLKKLGKKITGMDQYQQKDIEFIQADITDNKSLKESLNGRYFDCIIHLASLPGDTGNAIQMVNVNINGFQNILEYALESKVKMLVLGSSVSSCGWYPATKFEPPDYMPVDEKHPCRPKNIYSTTKLMQELLALNYYYQYNLPITILRFTAIIGPAGKGGGRSWRDFAIDLAEGKKIQIPYFSKEELCHFVDIRDVARMLIAVSENKSATGEIFNCSGSKPTRGYEFEKIIKEISPGIKVEYGYPWSMAQGKEITLDMSKALNLLNFKPKYTVEDSIKSIKEWVDSTNIEEIKKNMKESFESGLKK